MTSRLLAALSFVTFTASAADWPEFRGSNAQGHSEAKNLPLAWSPTSHIEWKVPVAGIG